MLYDGECPLCMREVEMLRRRDSGRGAIDFVDIAAPDYDPAVHGGISFERAMERIHAVLRDGTVVTGERWLGWAGGAGALGCAVALVRSMCDRLSRAAARALPAEPRPPPK